MSLNDYNFPLALTKGYFAGKDVPPFGVYMRNFHHDFLKYLFFMCIQNAKGAYPINDSIDKIIGELNDSARNCSKPITKILIGEAPPFQLPNSNTIEYFYNTCGKWPSRSPWINAPKKALFNEQTFQNKVDFLTACARAGFLLLDLFPYAIKYNSRSTKKYEIACVSAFQGPYPFNIMDTLRWLTPCISKNIAIGFGLTPFGKVILSSMSCVNIFNRWTANNNINLITPLLLDQLRQIPINDTSNFLRICHKNMRNAYGPDPALLKQAGFF